MSETRGDRFSIMLRDTLDFLRSRGEICVLAKNEEGKKSEFTDSDIV